MDRLSNKTPLEDLIESLKEYLDMRIDATKLGLSENLTKISSRIVSFFLISLLLVLVIGFLALAFSKFLIYIIGSEILGLLLTALTLIIIALVLFFMRNKLFSNSILKMYLKIFFNNSDNDK